MTVKFADLPIGADFYDIHINARYTKTEAEPYLGKRLDCKWCKTPVDELLNARLWDGSRVHFCPDEQVNTDRVKVAF